MIETFEAEYQEMALSAIAIQAQKIISANVIDLNKPVQSEVTEPKRRRFK